MIILADAPQAAACARRPPAAWARIWDSPQAQVDLRLFCDPAPEAPTTPVLVTVRVRFPADHLAVEILYEQAAVPSPPNVTALAAACLAGLYGLWGGPPHFIRYAAALLAATTVRPCPN